ncbi:MAG: hypothetical protein JRG95_11290 [Deltaproteobacteria bacterium]|nr:hypothetical protein [Deltaproteobacteria bacterium]
MKRMILLLLLATLLLPGATCESGSVSPGTAVAWFSPPALSVPPLTAFELELWVTTSDKAQAYEFSLQYDSSQIFLYDVVPHPDFDDDGQFFVEPQIDFAAGTVSGVVDLCHGNSAGPTGSFQIATLYGWSYADGVSTVALSAGGVATEDGTDLTVTISDSVVTVTP